MSPTSVEMPLERLDQRWIGSEQEVGSTAFAQAQILAGSGRDMDGAGSRTQKAEDCRRAVGDLPQRSNMHGHPLAPALHEFLEPSKIGPTRAAGRVNRENQAELQGRIPLEPGSRERGCLQR